MKKLVLLIFIFYFIQLKAQNNQLWGTYYGGTEIGVNESGRSTDTDISGNVYLAGTISANAGIATFGAHQTIYGGGNRDAFLVKFDANGNRLWGTYYGATGLEIGTDVKTDGLGNVYLLVTTAGGNPGLSTAGAYQVAPAGGNDAVLVKFDSSGNRLWATYYGGTGGDTPFRLAIDGFNNVYLVGITNSNNGIAFGGFQNSIGVGPGSQDLFLAKFDPTGALLWSTYYGGGDNENGTPDVAVDCDNNVYITGTTRSTSSISSNGFQNFLSGSVDAFLVKFDVSGNRLWSTYYGGPGSPGIFGTSDADRSTAVTTDVNGNVYITGQTTSTANIVSNGHDTVYVPANPIVNVGVAYLAKFNAAGNRMWATYYGDDSSYGWSLVTDICGNVYMAGSTNELTPPSNISTSTGFQQANGGGNDIFLTMFDSTGNRLWATYFGGIGGDNIGKIALDINSDIYIAGETTSNNAIATIGAFKTTVTGARDNFLTKLTTGGCGKYTGNNCPIPLTLVTTFVNDSCNSLCAGTATTIPNGGTPPYTYLWSNGDTTQMADSLCAGIYTVTVTDSLSNVAMDTVTITEPPLITFSQSFTECQGFSVTVGTNTYNTTGIYTDTIFGGSASGCDSIVTTNLTINPLGLGIDSITSCVPVLWIDGNTYSASTNLPTDTILGGSANGCDSIVTLNLTINSAATSNDVITSCIPIIWIDGNTYSTTTNTPTFTFVGGAANGCDSIVSLNLTINSTASSTDIITSCTPITWIDGNTYSATTNTPTFTFVGGAANGCDSVVSLNLTINTPILTIQNFNECDGFSVTVGSNVYSTTGVYIDTINGCDTVVTNLIINPLPQLTLIKTDNNCAEDNGVVEAVVVSNSYPIAYNWSTGSTDSIINNLPSGSYSLIIADAEGCTDTAQVFVNDTDLDCEFFIYLPNAFSPNGDGKNDIFYVRGRGIETLSFNIYNRWGNKVFETTDIKMGWDGLYQGKEQNTGVFVYVVKGTFKSGKTFEESGDVGLIK